MCRIKSNNEVVQEALEEAWKELIKVRGLDADKAKKIIQEEVDYLIQSK